MIKTIVLSRNIETPVSGLDGLHAIIRNFSTGTIYVSANMNFSIGGDNVKTIPPLTADIIRDIVDSTVYIISPDTDAAQVECEGTYFVNQNFATTLSMGGVSKESFIYPTPDSITPTKYHILLSNDEPDGKEHDILSPIDGFSVDISSGSANVDGEVVVTIGNDIPSGKEGNKQGKIDIYGAGTGRTRITAPSTEEDIEIQLPNKSGALVSREEFTHYKSLVDANIPDEDITDLVDEIGDNDYDFEGDMPMGGVSKEYVDAQDQSILEEAKQYTDDSQQEEPDIPDDDIISLVDEIMDDGYDFEGDDAPPVVSGVTKEYVDAQDLLMLEEAKAYAKQYTDDSQQEEADREAAEELANDITTTDIEALVNGTSTDPSDITSTDIIDLINGSE